MENMEGHGEKTNLSCQSGIGASLALLFAEKGIKGGVAQLCLSYP